jgi:molybdenum cofactor cytidylyltransferase
MALAGPMGAVSVLRRLRAMNAVGEVEVDDAGVVTDIDTLDDLARAEALLLSRRGLAPSPASGRGSKVSSA